MEYFSCMRVENKAVCTVKETLTLFKLIKSGRNRFIQWKKQKYKPQDLLLEV